QALAERASRLAHRDLVEQLAGDARRGARRIGPCRAALLSRRPGSRAAPHRRRAPRGLDRAVAAGPSRPQGPAAGAGGHGRAGRTVPAPSLGSGGARPTDCAIVGCLSGRAPMKKTMLALALLSVATAAHAEN